MSLATVGSQLVVAGASGEQAFVWTQAGGIVDLQTKLQALYDNVSESFATGVNTAGQVIGYYTDSGSINHAFLYNLSANTLSNLDSWCHPGGLQNVTGINASGVFGGTYSIDGFTANTQTSTFAEVGAYGGADGTTGAYAINNSGWLAGEGETTAGTFNTEPVEWRGSSTGWVMLPTWTGDNSDASYLEAIDGAGDAVGYTVPNHPIYYNDALNTTVELPLAPGKTGGKAFGINDNGLVVGDENSTAFVQSVAGGTPGTGQLLNNLIPAGTGWNLQDAYAVDNSGDIVGSGTLNGVADDFLLQPALPGDANGDGAVDVNDLTIVLSHFGQTGTTWSQGEFTGDGTVDVNDLTIVLAHFGQAAAGPAAGPVAVPEPAGLAMVAALLAAAVWGLARRCG
jgi:probable HAF family extracellular repeat protein